MNQPFYFIITNPLLKPNLPLRYFLNLWKAMTPYCRKTDKNIDDSADDSHLSAEKPCDDVKAEDTDAAPVKAADYKKRQRYSVKHSKSSFNDADSSVDTLSSIIHS